MKTDGDLRVLNAGNIQRLYQQAYFLGELLSLEEHPVRVVDQ